MADITDGTAVFRVGDKRMQALVDFFFPVGSIIARDDDDKPEILNYGQWIKIATDRVLQGGGQHSVGSDVRAGLPNITGDAKMYYNGDTGGWHFKDAKVTGAFVKGDVVQTACSWSAYNSARSLKFDASLSNKIYGSSNTVQPPAHIVNFWKRIE